MISCGTLYSSRTLRTIWRASRTPTVILERRYVGSLSLIPATHIGPDHLRRIGRSLAQSATLCSSHLISCSIHSTSDLRLCRTQCTAWVRDLSLRPASGLPLGSTCLKTLPNPTAHSTSGYVENRVLHGTSLGDRTFLRARLPHRHMPVSICTPAATRGWSPRMCMGETGVAIPRRASPYPP